VAAAAGDERVDVGSGRCDLEDAAADEGDGRLEAGVLDQLHGLADDLFEEGVGARRCSG
jgi:hypothetical protein